MAVANDGSNRLFILEQGGRIRIVKEGNLVRKPFLDISAHLDKLNSGYSEKGLLGLAFHPQYKSNGRFFVYYSAPASRPGYDHNSIVAEYKVSANADSAMASERIVLEIPEPESNHNGGCLQFGPDGFLYIGLGDGGGAGDKHGSNGNAQDLSTWLGKILRIDVDSKEPYAVPADNPFPDKEGVLPEIFAYGLRNPWRFSFDRFGGRLFCGDVGQDDWEEIDIVEKGKNYGWRIMEGDHCYYPAHGCNMQGLKLPITEYSHKEGISICGGYVYRGSENSWNGNYIFADWSGKLFFLSENKEGNWTRRPLRILDTGTNDAGMNINSMGEDENGEIYLLTQKSIGPYSGTGALYRLLPGSGKQ